MTGAGAQTIIDEQTANVCRFVREKCANHPLLFDLGRQPTTRDVANLVREGGTAALTEAERRAERRATRRSRADRR